MQIPYDVVVVGAGPIGITTACSLKAIHNHLNICVIDKRAEPGRSHGLRINADSVTKINTLLDQAKQNQFELTNSDAIDDLRSIFEGWSENFIRTSQIENDLAKTANQMGITVLRGKEYVITKDNFEPLCKKTHINSKLYDIFETAKVVIGADGAHSVVREVVMGNKFSHEQTLRHLVELKYQTAGKMVSRGYTEALVDTVGNSRLTFETTSKDQSKPTKPVTLHLFVPENTYNNLRIKDEKGNLKGVFGNSWTIIDLKHLSESDEDLKRFFHGQESITDIYKQIQDYLESIRSRGGTCENEQISTLTLSIYRSEKSVDKFEDKHVLLVGDAESGLVLERGFNKGLKGAAVCAQAVSNFFQHLDSGEKEELFSFQSYEDEMLAIFNREQKLAVLKNMALESVETSFASSRIMTNAGWSVVNYLAASNRDEDSDDNEYNVDNEYNENNEYIDENLSSGCTLF